uniref:Uncharacterized protein n=1 Tax=Arundo donax TaxID=35708 RepID=A0A0A9C6A4_ARUDO
MCSAVIHILVNDISHGLGEDAMSRLTTRNSALNEQRTNYVCDKTKVLNGQLLNLQ